MTTVTASEARANLYRRMDQAAESHQPVLISSKRGNAVLIAEEDRAAIQETLFLLSVPGMRESIKAGMAESADSCATELDWWVVESCFQASPKGCAPRDLSRSQGQGAGAVGTACRESSPNTPHL